MGSGHLGGLEEEGLKGRLGSWGWGFTVLRVRGKEVAGTGVMGIIRGIPEEAPLVRV